MNNNLKYMVTFRGIKFCDMNIDIMFLVQLSSTVKRGARWLSGRVSDSGARGPGFETYRRRVVSLIMFLVKLSSTCQTCLKTSLIHLNESRIVQILKNFYA